MEPITELWTPVLINNGIFKNDYIVSNLGRVKKKRIYKDGSSKFVLITIIDTKRPVVKMRSNGKQYRKSVAKLVLSSFHYRNGCECANITYLDGNMKNCKLSNLMYTVDKKAYDKAEKDNKKPKPTLVAQIRSCKTCTDFPCFSGMETLSSDFGAEGCRRYKVDYNKLNN